MEAFYTEPPVDVTSSHYPFKAVLQATIVLNKWFPYCRDFHEFLIAMFPRHFNQQKDI